MRLKGKAVQNQIPQGGGIRSAGKRLDSVFPNYSNHEHHSGGLGRGDKTLKKTRILLDKHGYT